MMPSVRVLLVDDHVLFRRGLSLLLQESGAFEIVGEAGNGRETLAMVERLMPDLILMDITMPEMNGIEVTRHINTEFPYIKIVMLTASEDDSDLYEALKNGAIGYLLKGIDPLEMIEMLKGAAEGNAAISRMTASKIIQEWRRSEAVRPDENPRRGKLTSREEEILRHLATGQSNKEIASSLGISENTVRNHTKNILEKLHLKNRVQAVIYSLKETQGKTDTQEPR